MAMPGPLPFNLKLAFGVGQAAEGLKNGAFGTFVLFYYNQVLGLPGTLAGIAVGTALIVDAFTDPLAGSISDHWQSRHGRRHPFMYASIVPLAVTFYFLFHPLVSTEFGLFLWLIAFSNLSRTAMTLYHVPHLALGAEMTDDFAERSSVVGFRQFFATLGGLAATVIGFWIFFVPTAEFRNGQLNEGAYAPFALTLAVLMSITIFWSAYGTRAVIPYLPKAAPQTPISVLGTLLRTLTDLAAAMRCGSFRWLFAGVLIVFVMVGVDGALNIYIYTYFWEFSHNEIVALAPAYPIGVLLGALIAPKVLGRFGKRFGVMFGTSSWATWQIIPIVARFMGWFPENGDPILVPLLVAIRVIQGASTVQANVAFGSMVADTVDEHELNTGKRQEGIFFASSSFAAKAASGMGNIIAGFALDLISWPRGTHVKTAADVPPDAIVELGMLYGPYVAGCGFISVWCYTRYRLTRERHAEILAELYARRGGGPSLKAAS